jgi:peptidoglycan/xylan/chitin deacetylase (PgdA/CDA1 family)
MWPDDASCAACFTFDFDAEEVWIGEDPNNVDRPGVLSQGTYGAKVAVPAILDLLARQDLRATFFVPGRVAERHPERVKEIVSAGHELALHGYTHRSVTTLGASEEEEEMRRGLEVLRSFSPDVSGYRSPSWELTPQTLTLVSKYGLTYSSNLMDDIRPYRHQGSEIVELPISWVLDDAPHFWFDGASWNRKIATNDEVRSIWRSEFDGIRAMGGAFVLTMHPQIIGRPGRLPLLEEIIGYVRSHRDVWMTTAHELADVARRIDHDTTTA